ncbi:MAG: hypothetical protein ACTSO9_15730 [Candidatus Helarchaeota archaeon]
MSFLEKLDDWPSPEKTRIGLILGLVLLIVIYLVMAIFLIQSGDTTNMIESELSFSGFKMKMQYLPMVLNGGINAYRVVQILDYVFMLGYGSLIFCLALIIGRKFDSGTAWRLLGYIFAMLGIVAVGLDIGENAFILLTLSDPLFFPDWWTVAHSMFSLPKWIIIFSAIIWAIIAAIKLKI